MTTGSYEHGSGSTPFYQSKSWSGTDGRTVVVIPAHRVARYRLVSTKGRPPFSKVYYSWVRGKRHLVTGPSSWHTYSLIASTRVQTRGMFYDGRPGNWLANSYFNSPKSVSFPSNFSVRLQNKIASAARGHQFNLELAIGRPRQLVELMCTTVQRFNHSISLLRRGRVPEACRALLMSPRGSHQRRSRVLTLQDVSALWLEMQYAWKPLLKDISAGAETLAYYNNAPRTSRFTVSASLKSHASQSDAYAASYGELVSSQRVIVVMTEQLSVPRSLGLADPYSLPWDLLPWSFVADWFIPIGVYLDNLAIIPNISAAFCITERHKYHGTASGKISPYLGAHSDLTNVILTRGMSSHLAVVKPEFVLPKTSTTHFWNSLALLNHTIMSPFRHP